MRTSAKETRARLADAPAKRRLSGLAIALVGAVTPFALYGLAVGALAVARPSPQAASTSVAAVQEPAVTGSTAEPKRRSSSVRAWKASEPAAAEAETPPSAATLAQKATAEASRAATPEPPAPEQASATQAPSVSPRASAPDLRGTGLADGGEAARPAPTTTRKAAAKERRAAKRTSKREIAREARASRAAAAKTRAALARRAGRSRIARGDAGGFNVTSYRSYILPDGREVRVRADPDPDVVRRIISRHRGGELRIGSARAPAWAGDDYNDW